MSSICPDKSILLKNVFGVPQQVPAQKEEQVLYWEQFFLDHSEPKYSIDISFRTAPLCKYLHQAGNVRKFLWDKYFGTAPLLCPLAEIATKPTKQTCVCSILACIQLIQLMLSSEGQNLKL